ncbi:MAG: folylpolyglutamate synthase/dihydrofolate synthase family protein [Planctomycetota bacterium]
MPSLDDNPRRQSAIDFLWNRINYERPVSGKTSINHPFRLERMRSLLRHLSLDHYMSPGAPIVHIAGTKGKGSTALFVTELLRASGKKVGTYTSPHLECIEERFRINGDSCSSEILIKTIEKVQPVVQSMDDEPAGPPTFFELTTAIAFQIFADSECDVIVLEVGLGGRLDSTNVCSPAVTAITSIGLDHQHILGDTLEEIAFEKAGIIKPDTPVVCGRIDESPLHVIRKIAKSQASPIKTFGEDFDVQSIACRPWGSKNRWTGNGQSLSFDLAMEGEHQAINAAVAIEIVRQLCRATTINFDPDWTETLSNVSAPGRLERHHLAGPTNDNGTWLWIDSAHNKDSMQALVNAIEIRSASPVDVIFGTSSDKDAQGMLEQLAPVTRRVFVTQFKGNPRFVPAEQLEECLPPSLTDGAVTEKDLSIALDRCVSEADEDSVIVACGSFFIAAEAKQWLRRYQRTTS